MTFQELQTEAKRFESELSEKVHIRIGTPTCGRAAGALDVLLELKKEISRRGLDVRIVEVGCMGLCYAEPLVIIFRPGQYNVVYQNITPDKVSRLIEGYIEGDDPCLELALGTLEIDPQEGPIIPELQRFEFEKRIVMKRCGIVDPRSLYHYVAYGGYEALDRVLDMDPEYIIEEIKRSGLRGRGGAGFPTGIKWEECFKVEADEKYIICNADEGDPGAFMDRVVLESDPHQVIEGMIIAGYAIGARKGYIYIRAEYPLAIEIVRKAIGDAEEAGILGDNVLGKGFSFSIDLVEGAGAFVSGEETGLMAAIEGKRSEPRIRPPYPVHSGLFGMPTVVDNVKTLSYVPHIVIRGADWFSGIGTERSKGTAIFTLAGKIEFSGLTEVPMGTKLEKIAYEIGGGGKQGCELKAIQIGGPSGGCIPRELFNVPVDYDSLTSLGSMMGSGGMIFMDESDCVVDTAKFFLEFVQKESCGKCTMCRIGTVQLLLILEKITKGQGSIEDLEKLKSLAEDVRIGSLCGLGKSAPNPILTTLRYFYDEYVAHVKEKRCPALSCKELIAYYILPEKCDRACEHCKLTCPTSAIKGEKGEPKSIEQEKCVKCGTCMKVCPPEYSAIVKVSPVAELKKYERKE